MSAHYVHLTPIAPPVMTIKTTESLLKDCTSATAVGNNIAVHILEYLSIVKAHPTGYKDLAVEFVETSQALFATQVGLTGVVRLGSKLEDAVSKSLGERLHQTKNAFTAYAQVVDKLLSSEKKHIFGKLRKNIRKAFAEGDMEKIKISMIQCRADLEANPLPSTSGDTKIEAAQCIGYTALAAVLERPFSTQRKPTLHTRQISNVLTSLPPPPPSPSGPLPLPPIPHDVYTSPSSPLRSGPWSPAFSENSFHELHANGVWNPGNEYRNYMPSDRGSAFRSDAAFHEHSTLNEPGSEYRSHAASDRGDDVSEVTSFQSVGHTRGNSSHFSDHLKQIPSSGDSGIQHQLSIRAKLDPSKAPNSVMPNGETPFTHAMNKSTPMSLVERMLSHGANPDLKNSHGETALFKAIACERLDLVNRLLEAGADPNLPGPKILLWPAVHQPQMLEALLTHGADLKRAPGVLELSTSINSPEAVSILLRHGVDVNAKKDGIYTPLCSAIRDDRGDLVETLLKAKADPNLPALDYPLFKAVSYHRTQFLPSLIAAGADLNKPKGLIECAVSHENKDSLLFLLNQNVDIDINARNSAGHTALSTAIRDDQLEFIDILLAHGADPGIRGQDWPISMAVKRPDILAKLLPHITTSRIIKGVLEMAVVANQLESVKLLLAKGVNVEEKNAGVFSPLTTSIRENRKDIFRYLVDVAKADTNAPGEHLPIIKAVSTNVEYCDDTLLTNIRSAVMAKKTYHTSNICWPTGLI